MKIQDVMTPQVISIQPSTTVEEIARLFTLHRISAVPVVDGHNRVLGIVSEHDLFLKEKGIPFSMERLPALFDEWIEPEELPQMYQATRHYTAADVMTGKVHCANSDDTVGEVARQMVECNLKRVPIVENERLVGIVTRSDRVGLLLRERV